MPYVVICKGVCKQLLAEEKLPESPVGTPSVAGPFDSFTDAKAFAKKTHKGCKNGHMIVQIMRKEDY